MTNPDQIEHDIDGTRDSLRTDIGRLTDKVSPSAAVSGRVDKLKTGANSMKERLMGAADGTSPGDVASSAKDKAGAVTAGMGDALGGAPDTLRDQTRGNPLAAGVIAFGVGWLLSSLAPASSAEQDAAARIEANAGGVVDPLKQSAQQVAGNLQQPLQESADKLKGAATDAVDKTAQHAKSATDDVSGQLAT